MIPNNIPANFQSFILVQSVAPCACQWQPSKFDFVSSPPPLSPISTTPEMFSGNYKQSSSNMPCHDSVHMMFTPEENKEIDDKQKHALMILTLLCRLNFNRFNYNSNP